MASLAPEGGEDAPDSGDPSALYLRLHHASIFVRDQDRSLAFYREKLKFNLVADHHFGEQQKYRYVVVAPPNGTGMLALVADPDGSGQSRNIKRDPQLVFVSNNIDEQYRAWTERGVRFLQPPRQADWGGAMAMFEDDDGNRFALVAWDELAREVEQKRRAEAAKIEADRRAAQELEIAKQVQARLFPQSRPQLPTLNYSGLCLQAREVGGDYYDFVQLAEGRLGFVVGDISGKGIAAALLMANLQASLRSQFALASEEPERFLEGVNQLFFANTTPGAYATLFFAEYNDRTQLLRYANCGHLPALLLRSKTGAMEHLESTSTVVGLFHHWHCEMQETELSSGDLLLIYTDGVTESFSATEEEYGEQRLADALRRYSALDPEALRDALVEDVRQFAATPLQDDVTLIVIRCTGSQDTSRLNW